MEKSAHIAAEGKAFLIELRNASSKSKRKFEGLN